MQKSQRGSYVLVPKGSLTEDDLMMAVREAGARSWREEPIMNFQGSKATDAWMGRLVPSRHNTSAPDMLFERFDDGR